MNIERGMTMTLTRTIKLLESLKEYTEDELQTSGNDYSLVAIDLLDVEALKFAIGKLKAVKSLQSILNPEEEEAE